MSSASTPIPPHLFATALHDLPLANVYAKAAELRNSVAHLTSSNDALRPLAEAGDAECAEAVVENEAVMARMRERVRLCRAEVEGRGARWHEGGDGGESRGEGEGEGERVNGIHRDGEGGNAEDGERRRLTDEELRGELEARFGAEEDEGEEGVHL